MKRLIVLGLLVINCPVWANMVDPGLEAGGYARGHTRVFSASTVPRPLPRREPTAQEADAIRAADTVFENNATLSMLIVDHGKIIYERYREPASESTPMMSFSMSKSLTAMTIGAILCRDRSINLDQAADTYAPELRGTVLGESSIRHLLMMASGIGEGAFGHGEQTRREFPNLLDGSVTSESLFQQLPGRNRTFPIFGTPVASGTRFVYNGTDTMALSTVAEHRGGFLGKFDEYIWRQAGAEAPAHWLINPKDQRAVSQSGFLATTRDWARLAMLSMELRTSADACTREFMQAATGRQITNETRRVGRAFDYYGYQTWVKVDRPGQPEISPPDRDTYWWVGYAGQRVGVNPRTQQIIVVTSYREDYMGDVYRLFRKFDR